MTPVEQLGDDSLWVVCAALCHMALVFAIKHLHDIFDFVLYSSIPFFFSFLYTFL